MVGVALCLLLFAASVVHACSNADQYFLMGVGILTTQRIDPIVSPGKVASHVHTVAGGSNFGFNISTDLLRKSACTTIPISQDHSNYWVPSLYFQWNNGSFSSVSGGMTIYYHFDEGCNTTPFPDNFRMISGDPILRSHNSGSFAQQAISHKCLDYPNDSTIQYPELPVSKSCPNGTRSQINFPSCWDGQNVDSPDHRSHVSFRSGGPDSGGCTGLYPKSIPRIFVEVYWDTGSFDQVRTQAKDPDQPFVYSNGDPTGYGYHGDFYNGWDENILQKILDQCQCTATNFGDLSCCYNQQVVDKNTATCRITNLVDEPVLGNLPKLPGNNPVQPPGPNAQIHSDPSTPAILSPAYVYTGIQPSQVGTVITSAYIATATTQPGAQSLIFTPSASARTGTSALNATYSLPRAQCTIGSLGRRWQFTSLS